MGFSVNSIPSNDEVKVVNNLLNDIIVNNKSHISTGILGVPHLFDMLSYYGYQSLAFDLLTTKD